MKDVYEDPAAFAEMSALGLMAIPVTVIDGRIVRGFDERALRAALQNG